jgi:hypothetical protein
VAAQHVHLPQAVVRGDVTLSEDEVVDAGGGDGRHAVCIALDVDGVGKALDVQSAVYLWQGSLQGVTQPQARAHGGQHGGNHEEKQNDDNTQGYAASVCVMRGRAAQRGCCCHGCP